MIRLGRSISLRLCISWVIVARGVVKMKQIQLTQNKTALIDDEDFELVNEFKWCAVQQGRNFYATRGYWNKQTKKTKQIRMHRLIMDVTDPKIEIDHINGDGLNNQRYNLRICTRSQNQRNKRKQNNTTSKYEGVHWHKQHNKWIAKIRINGQRKHLGCFLCEIDAACYYDYYAIKYFDEFAKLNFPDFDYSNFQPRKFKDTTSSKYRGVSWYNITQKWRSCIKVNGKQKSLGYFNNEKEAAKAYNKAAKKYFKEFAKLNEVNA